MRPVAGGLLVTIAVFGIGTSHTLKYLGLGIPTIVASFDSNLPVYDFAAKSVFGLPALASIPIRVDCGNSDPFYSATKSFIAQLPNPPAGGFSPGGHDGAYWSSQLPGELTWMAPLLTA